MTANPSISASELQILKVLWETGPGTVRELLKPLRRRGRRWAYATVSTLLQRLEAKGYVTSDRSDVAFVFHAAVSRDALIRQRLSDIADQLCEGTTTPLVLALVKGRKPSAGELRQFRELLDALEAEKGRRTRDEGRKG